MSTLPLIFSASSLDNKPKRQGGVFSLSPSNKVKMNKSQQMMNASKMGFDPKASSLSLYSIPRKGPGRIGRYSNQIFGETSSFVSPDTDAHLHKNPQQVDSVGTITKRITVSMQLMGAYLRNQNQTLNQLKSSLQHINSSICQELNKTEVYFTQKMKSLRQGLSAMRKQTGKETKTNKVQQIQLWDNMITMKQFYEKQNCKVLSIMEQCQLQESEIYNGEHTSVL